MNKIIDYTTIGTNGRELGEMVKVLLDIGWQPYGSPTTNGNGLFVQAMVKYEGKPVNVVDRKPSAKKQADDLIKSLDNIIDCRVAVEGQFTYNTSPIRLSHDEYKLFHEWWNENTNSAYASPEGIYYRGCRIYESA